MKEKFPIPQFKLAVALAAYIPQGIYKSYSKEVKKSNANESNYAYLYDRVEVNAGQKQLFGTQVTYEVNKTGRAIPKNGLMDSVNVDNRRKEYGLEPLVKYLNSMTMMHEA